MAEELADKIGQLIREIEASQDLSRQLQAVDQLSQIPDSRAEDYLLRLIEFKDEVTESSAPDFYEGGSGTYTHSSGPVTFPNAKGPLASAMGYMVDRAGFHTRFDEGIRNCKDEKSRKTFTECIERISKRALDSHRYEFVEGIRDKNNIFVSEGLYIKWLDFLESRGEIEGPAFERCLGQMLGKTKNAETYRKIVRAEKEGRYWEVSALLAGWKAEERTTEFHFKTRIKSRIEKKLEEQKKPEESSTSDDSEPPIDQSGKVDFTTLQHMEEEGGAGGTPPVSHY